MSDDQHLFDVYRGDGAVRGDACSLLPRKPILFDEIGAYLADPGLVEAVNIAVCVGQPLLVTGEPGCGKTRLAWSVSRELGLGEPLLFFTRSTSRAQDLLYTYDAVRRFHDIQSGNLLGADPENYIRYEALGQAIVEGRRRVVLIDEIDKAPRDFPNDLLNELDRMTFEVRELDEGRIKSAELRPIVIITSNSEMQLPLPFLRRCVFFHIGFPNYDKLIDIVRERLGADDIDDGLIKVAVERFLEVREIKGLTKKPATGELLTWVLALNYKGIQAAEVRAVRLSSLPLWQSLLKDRGDYRRLLEAS